MPVFTTCVGPRTDGGRIGRHDLAHYQPVEQPADRGQLLLDAGRRGRTLQPLHVGADIERPNCRKHEAAALAPGQKVRAGPRIGAARMEIPNRGTMKLFAIQSLAAMTLLSASPALAQTDDQAMSDTGICLGFLPAAFALLSNSALCCIDRGQMAGIKPTQGAIRFYFVEAQEPGDAARKVVELVTYLVWGLLRNTG